MKHNTANAPDTMIEDNPLAPERHRPAHPHPKQTSRRLLKKRQQLRGEPAEPAARAKPRKAERPARAGARSSKGPSALAMLAPIGAIAGLALAIRASHR